MPIISYINECKAFCEYASEEKLSDNEVVLWHALFNLVNQRATSNHWPEAFLPLTNAKVLSMTPWGSGNSAVEKLRRTRDRLIQRGLIAYEAGERRKRAPMYQLRYFCPMDAKGFTPQNMVNGVGNTEGNREGNGVGNGVDIKEKDQDRNPDPVPTHSVKPVVPDSAREGAAGWPKGGLVRPGGYKRADGTVGVCRFDQGWETSGKARGAIAQRLMDSFDGDNDISDLWTRLCELMEDGLPPEVIEDVMPGFQRASLLLARLNTLYMVLGYEARRTERDRERQWAADLSAARGDVSLAQRFQRMRADAQESEVAAWQ